MFSLKATKPSYSKRNIKKKWSLLNFKEKWEEKGKDKPKTSKTSSEEPRKLLKEKDFSGKA
jgi:hypothetical protein